MKGLEALKQLKYYNTLANDDFDMTKELSAIETDLEKLEKLELAFALLRQHIRLYNIRGECSITMNGISHKEISEELYKSLLEIFL